MGKPEGKIEQYLKSQAEKKGFFCVKFTSPGTRGVPDRLLIGHGHTVFIELKKQGEHTRLSQDCVIENIRKYGGEVYVIDSKSSVDNVLRYLVEGGSYEPPSKQVRKPTYIGKNKTIVRNNRKENAHGKTRTVR